MHTKEREIIQEYIQEDTHKDLCYGVIVVYSLKARKDLPS